MWLPCPVPSSMKATSSNISAQQHCTTIWTSNSRPIELKFLPVSCMPPASSAILTSIASLLHLLVCFYTWWVGGSVGPRVDGQ